MDKKIVLALVVFASLFLGGCVRVSRTKSPVGESNKTDVLFVSVETTDTRSREIDCRQVLAQADAEGKTADMLPREVYQTCFNNGMLAVEPGRGQRSDPVPVTGRESSVAARYNNGAQVPYGMYPYGHPLAMMQGGYAPSTYAVMGLQGGAPAESAQQGSPAPQGGGVPRKHMKGVVTTLAKQGEGLTELDKRVGAVEEKVGIKPPKEEQPVGNDGLVDPYP